jgi:hypothetical protein
MKSLKATVLTAGLLVFSFGSVAQTDLVLSVETGTATISDSYCVMLDDSKPIQSYYSINIDGMFESEYEAKKKFGHISNNLLTYKVNWAEKKAVLWVHTERTPKLESVGWWNDYLDSLCK